MGMRELVGWSKRPTSVEALAKNHFLYYTTMKEILEAALTNPAARNVDALEVLAVENTEFLSWT